MEIHRFTDVAAFYQRVEAFLLTREAEHCLQLGLCATMLSHPEAYASPYLACVEYENNVVAVAIQTPPHNVALSYTDLPSALDLIAGDLVTIMPTLPGVMGRPHLSAHFAATWQRLSGQACQLHMQQRIYRLERVQPVTRVPGHLRRATSADVDLVVAWLTAFNREAHADADIVPARLRDMYFGSDARVIFLWEDERIVALAGHTGPTPHGMRVGPVYTPPDLRGKGYASACVAALSQSLLDGGRQFCCLFTDLSNPTANHIYQALGYQPVADVDVYHFAAV